jgi:hypothetical protein
MKLKLIFVSMFALAALASCSNDNEGLDNGPSVPEQGPGAYLSVAINMPSSVNTRATGDTGPGSEAGTDGTNGTKDENEVNTVYLLTYKSGIRVGELRPLTPEELGTIGQGTTVAAAGEAIKVDKDIDEVFVVINPSAKTLSSITLNTNKSALTTAIEESVNDLMLPATGFMMTSDSGFVAVVPKVAVTETTAGIDAAKQDAKNNPIKIGVDRAVVKTKLAAFTSTSVNTTNGTASVDGWKLNTTNKKYFPHAELVTYQKAGADVTDAKYRKDPNFTGLAMAADGTGAAATEFNWLTNKTAVDWNNWTAPKDIEYCLENTMDAGSTNQNYNNTTKMIIKARFAPTNVTLGTSWFRVGGVVLTFDELNASYANASTTDKPKYEEFLDKLLDIVDDKGVVVTPRTKGWKGETGYTTEVALSDLDAVANGGYKAATVTDGNYLIEYFQKSVCYYDVNLKHDNRVEPFLLGRWGVVRNNAYTVTINKISQPGLPYIPDPTDPDIVDPSNPDPENPTPDDQESAFIAVSITVNNWTTWSQGVDL